MLIIKRAVIRLAATAQGQQANQNCKVTKDVCLELAPKPTSCTTNELAIGCKELFAHCGPVCNLHLSESIECQLYGDVKKVTETPSIPYLKKSISLQAAHSKN